MVGLILELGERRKFSEFLWLDLFLLFRRNERFIRLDCRRQRSNLAFQTQAGRITVEQRVVISTLQIDSKTRDCA